MKRLLVLIFIFSGLIYAQDSPHGRISIACETCHSTETWAVRTDASFNHQSTRFPLLGQHLAVACRDCHKDLVFTGMPHECVSCHTDIHRNDLGTNCERCHSPNSWNVTDIVQKHQSTRFPLIGAHTVAACDACHIRASEHRYAGTPVACIACHRQEFQATVAPNHVKDGFSSDCSKCHRVDAMHWPGGFDHILTGFPLTGAHVTVICSSCHLNNEFKRISAECYSCHVTDFAGTQSPNHVNGQFSHDCMTCHSTTAWSPATFDHTVTGFALTGAHLSASCQACHLSGNYQLTYSGCYTCHGTDFQQTTNPAHVSGNFSHDCSACHTTGAWQPATFDHSATAFALTGAHVATPCLSCHTGNNFRLTFVDCYTCHQTDYNKPTDPNHVSAQFSHMCQPCHTTSAWTPATFDHSTTRFVLTGKHLTTSCQACHVGGNYQIVYQNCYQCHQNDYQTAANPNHVSGNFSQNCQTCHTTAAWSPASFDHSATNFPLTGTHITTPCASCHVSGNYTLTYTDCYACHSTDFQKPTNPNHVTASFGHDCTPCHTTTAWIPSTFNHDQQYFRIYSGRHAGLWTLCATCHGNPADFKQFTCFNCHEHDQANTDSHHTQVSGYVYSSPACYNCHRGA